MRWSFGITTVPERRKDLLPGTLASLRTAGFDPALAGKQQNILAARLFADGEKSENAAGLEAEFGIPVTARWPAVRIHANWVLSLYEMYLRSPEAERFALFQDDLVACRNLRQYLERCLYPDKCYWNLFTFRNNDDVIHGKPKGWHEGFVLNPETKQQKGLGAVALVFSKQAVMTLLSQLDMVDRVQNPHRGWRAVDGGIVTAMNRAGWREHVHNPSLVQHTGLISTMPNHHNQQLAVTFPGEDFDALSLLSGSAGYAEPPGRGPKAYSSYPEEVQNCLTAAWETEVAALRRAIEDDMVRFQAASGHQRRHFAKHIARYNQDLARLLCNDPPWIPPDLAEEVKKCPQAAG